MKPSNIILKPHHANTFPLTWILTTIKCCYGFLNWRSQFWDQPFKHPLCSPWRPRFWTGSNVKVDRMATLSQWIVIILTWCAWESFAKAFLERICDEWEHQVSKYQFDFQPHFTLLVLRFSWNLFFFRVLCPDWIFQKAAFLRKGLCCELVLPTVCRLREVLPDPRVGAKGALYPRSCWRAGATRHECAMLK